MLNYAVRLDARLQLGDWTGRCLSGAVDELVRYSYLGSTDPSEQARSRFSVV